MVESFRKYRLYAAAIVLAAGVGLLVWADDHGQVKGWAETVCISVCLAAIAVIVARGRRSKALYFSMICLYFSALAGFHWTEHKSSIPEVLFGVNALIFGWSAVDSYRSDRKLQT